MALMHFICVQSDRKRFGFGVSAMTGASMPYRLRPVYGHRRIEKTLSCEMAAAAVPGRPKRFGVSVRRSDADHCSITSPPRRRLPE